MGQFGFGPAFYMIRYNDEVLQDSKDVSIRGDGSIAASGSQYATAIGLEVHYNFSFGGSRCCLGPPVNWKSSRGFLASPFLGIYDLDNGINGMIVGALFGYWRGDGNYENKTSLNIGIGYTVHKDQLVLIDGIVEGAAPPVGLNIGDYTERKGVDGWALTLSASIGF